MRGEEYLSWQQVGCQEVHHSLRQCWTFFFEYWTRRLGSQSQALPLWQLALLQAISLPPELCLGQVWGH